MTNVTVYEQDCFGRIQYRAVRDDGCLLFGRHQTDFDTKDEALAAVLGEFRREKLGPVKVRLVTSFSLGGKANNSIVLHEGDPAPSGWDKV